MSFKLLSQLEITRRNKEEALGTLGFHASLIVGGIFIILTSIIALAFIGIAAIGENQGPSTEPVDLNLTPICASVTAFFGLFGLLVILISTLRRRTINREIDTIENEYQQLHAQAIDNLESR